MVDVQCQRSSSGKHKVFVYGTLKKNLPNHDWITDKNKGIATFIGKGYTAKKFPLVIASQWHIPCLLYHENLGHQVIGEVYEVDDQMLKNLDVLEEHPDFYERTKELIQLSADSPNSPVKETIEAWVYFIKKFNKALLQEDFLSDYQNSDDGKKYVARYLRDPTKIHRAVIKKHILNTD